jgi:hypothetical protein
MFYNTLYSLYMPFFTFIHFCFQINYSSIMIIQKNRPFGDKNETNQKMRCIMYTGSSRRIIYHLRKLKDYSSNTCLRKLVIRESRRKSANRTYCRRFESNYDFYDCYLDYYSRMVASSRTSSIHKPYYQAGPCRFDFERPCC